MTLFFIWVGCAFGCSIIAGAKHRGTGNWFLAGIIGGILALIVIAALPALPDPDAPMAPIEDRAPCPQCREGILRGATVCRFCGARIQW